MIKSCEQYHDESTYRRHHLPGHSLDWNKQPSVYKVYQGIEPLEMPRDIRLPKGTLSSLLKAKRGEGGSVDDLQGLSRLLLLTSTLTARARHPGGDFYYRSAASAGALYPTEIYVGTRRIGGLEEGLYHFAIHRHGLHPLRRGDFTGHIREITRVQGARWPMLTLFLTAIFFRSAWKYRIRAYRYHLLDTGHVLEDLMLALNAERLPASLSYDFEDQEVNRLLGIDGEREVALAVVHVFGSEAFHGREGPKLSPLPETIRRACIVSAREIDDPAMAEVHRVTSQVVEGEVPEIPMAMQLGPEPENWTKIKDLPAWPERLDYPEAVFQRRSKRNFVERAVAANQMSPFLEALCSCAEGDPGSPYDDSLAIGFLVGRVNGMTEGFYLFDGTSRAFGRVRSGSFTEKMARICLDQMWLAKAGVHFLFLTNLEVVSRSWGPRGYRYAMLTAGRLGQRLYIVATAMGLGCCGIGAFYDGEAGELLGLNKTSRLLYLVAAGAVKNT